MSTLIKTVERQDPLHLSDLRGYFEQSFKNPSQLQIGIENECFLVEQKTQEALPFSGERGVESILNELAEGYGWQKVVEKGRTVALIRGKELISLEPGGQIEIATEPLANLTGLQGSLIEFQSELEKIAAKGGIQCLQVGFQPQSSLESIEWVPKARYDLMRARFALTGTLGHDMMKRTASTQVSLDYTDESDAFKKVRLGLWASPFAALLAANSPLKEGKPWDWVVPRVLIWANTDPVRSGVPALLLKPGATFQNYIDSVLDIPMIFIVREGKWISVSKTFRSYLAAGHEKYRPTLDDFELHLSALFPEVRLRRYIEMRQADSVSVPQAVALAAFWKGLLYSSGTLESGLELFNSIAIDEFLQFRLASAEKGMNEELAGRPAKEYMKVLIDLAQSGLQALNEDPRILGPLILK